MVEELTEDVTTIDGGVFFPKEFYLRNIAFNKSIKQVNVSCGCVHAHYKPNSKVLRIKWNMMKEFPFQVEEDRLGTSQIVTVIFTDDTQSKIKLFGALLNPIKW